MQKIVRSNMGNCWKGVEDERSQEICLKRISGIGNGPEFQESVRGQKIIYDLVVY